MKMATLQHCCMASLVSNWRSEDVSSEPTALTGKPMSINDIPNEIMLKILSYVGPEDLCRTVAKVCERWNALAKDVTLWNTLSYSCDRTSVIRHVVKVRCAALLGLSTN
jgi:hypothetical protein